MKLRDLAYPLNRLRLTYPDRILWPFGAQSWTFVGSGRHKHGPPASGPSATDQGGKADN